MKITTVRNTNTNLSLLLYLSYGNFVTTFACLILARFYNSPRTVSVKVLTLPAVAAEPILRGIKHLLHVTNSDKRCTCWFKSLFTTWLPQRTILFCKHVVFVNWDYSLLFYSRWRTWSCKLWIAFLERKQRQTFFWIWSYETNSEDEVYYSSLSRISSKTFSWIKTESRKSLTIKEWNSLISRKISHVLRLTGWK